MPLVPLKINKCIRDHLTVDAWDRSFGFDRRNERRDLGEGIRVTSVKTVDDYRDAVEYDGAQQFALFERLPRFE